MKGTVKEAISGEGMEKWQSAFLIDAACCNSDSLGCVLNAAAGLHFTFPTDLIRKVSYTCHRVAHHS